MLGVNPGAGALPNSRTTFGPKINYLIKVDTNGDAKADIKYMYKFGKPNSMGVQRYDLWRNGTWLADGLTGTESTLDRRRQDHCRPVRRPVLLRP